MRFVKKSGLPWVWGFPWVWVRDGLYGDCDESLWVCMDSVGILNGCEIKRKHVKCTINIILDVRITSNRVKFRICFNYILGFLWCRYRDKGFRGSVGMGIPWGFPQVFFSGYGMGMGIEIQSPRQPWKKYDTIRIST